MDAMRRMQATLHAQVYAVHARCGALQCCS